MHKKVVLLCVAAVLAVGCRPQRELSKPYFVPYAEARETPLFVYNLPATMLEVQVTVRQTQSFRGPYSEYAEKYLGLPSGSVVARNSKYYEITRVEVAPRQTEDSAAWFAYIADPAFYPNVALAGGSSLAGLNMPGAGGDIAAGAALSINQPVPLDLSYAFSDLGMQKIVNEELQTVYRHVKKDSTVIRVPVQETVKAKRNDDQMARLAAEFITKVKNLRFELVAGLYEAFPEGESLRASIDELYAVERRYLELFTGRTLDTTYTYTFAATPRESGAAPHAQLLCYFDHEEGISLISPYQQYANNNRNQHLILWVAPAQGRPSPPALASAGGPVYRVPAMCDVRLYIGEESLYEGKLPVSQMGTLMQLPLETLGDKNCRLEFDPATGALRRLEAPDSNLQGKALRKHQKAKRKGKA